MKRAGRALAIALVACTRNAQEASSSATPSVVTIDASAPPKETVVSTRGPAFSLHADATGVGWCDGGGGHHLDEAGQQTDMKAKCAAPEANTSCEGTKAVVSTPGLGPDDRVDLLGASFVLKGHVHDCAGDGDDVLVATGSSVELLQGTGARSVVSNRAGDRVAMSVKWLVWTEGSSLHVLRR